MPTFTLSQHALARAVDMALEPDFINSLMAHPEVVRADRPNDDCLYVVKDGITAVCSTAGGDRHIVTFVPATREKWLEYDEQPIPGRQFRGDDW